MVPSNAATDRSAPATQPARRVARWAVQIGATTIAVAIALVLTSLHPWFREHSPFLLFVPAITVVGIGVLALVGILTTLAVAARRGAKEHLRLRERELRDFFANAPLALNWVGPDGTILRANQAELDLLGYTREQYIGRHISEFYADCEVAQDVLRRLASGEELRDYEVRLRAQDGSIRHVQITSNVLWEDARFIHTRCFTRDITERKRIEASLRASENWLLMALNAARMGTWDWNVQTGEVAWSPGLETMHGREPGSFGGTLADFESDIFPEDRERVERSIARSLEHGQEYHVEYRIILPDGSIRWLEARGKPYQDGADAPRHIAGICVDVTERRRFEEALLESEQHYRLVAEALPQIVWSARADGYKDYFNQQWYEFTGLTTPQSEGSGWQQALHPDDVRRYLTAWDEALARSDTLQIEFRLKQADGTYRWHLARALPLRNSEGRIVNWLGTATDIDDRRRSEESAQEVNRAKDEFLATLSHELRNPLNAMLGWTQVLRSDGVDTSTLARGLDSLERNAKIQAQLVEDLLDVSRIVSGKMVLDVRPLELLPVVEAALETVRPAADAKAITLVRVLDPAAGLVSGDPNRLQQVIWNLLSNAVKFTPKGGKVEVRLARVESLIEVVVSDTGRGIKPEFLPHVFERFRQADASTTRAYTGLGLGLAIVCQLVELHGGTVKADSPGEGKGATFTVRLPLLAALESPPSAGRTESPAVGDNGRPFPLHGLRVLVVDDQPDARDLLVQVLERGGASVSTAGTAAEAVSALQQIRPDVLVSDIGLPDEDGYALIRKVRRLAPERGGSVPAVALTAYAREEDRRLAAAAGFETHLAKPIEPGELVTEIIRLTGRIRGQTDQADT